MSKLSADRNEPALGRRHGTCSTWVMVCRPANIWRVLLPLALFALGSWVAAAAPSSEDLFRDAVEPLLRSRCVSCHGAEKQKGNLRLDSRDAAIKGGDLGPSIVPGDPKKSLLLQAVLHTTPDLEMPPKEKLSPADLAVLERWIVAGAAWPAPPVSAEAAPQQPQERLGDAWSDPRNPITRLFNGQRLDLWSLKPLRRPKVPDGNPASLHPIDRFVDDSLRRHGIEPAPPADLRALARRVCFDLTGLPPTPEAVNDLLADPSPEAYERYVDRLLASPRYGEHQARLWLDVVRYSDSNGFDWDEFRPQAWRFRDYVIRSFNADKPFGQFVREQLAGDELLDGPPRTPEEQEGLVASGYLRLGPQDNSAALFNEQSRARSEWLADLTETTGSAFLGLTLSCCRCHDHKFDPLSQADHFRLRSFFQPVRYGDELALDLAPDQEEIRRQHAALDDQIRPIKTDRDALTASVKERVRAERVAKLSDEERRWLAQSTDPQPQDFKEKSAEIGKRLEVSDDDAIKAATTSEKERHTALTKRIEDLAKSKRPFTRGLVATDNSTNVPVTHILFQGDHTAERAPVVPGFISVLDPNPAEVRQAPNPKTTGRRLALADWITSPENPLTARVLVNRAWQSFFGRGLVATPNDFGLAGARPTHPDLLDWLATEFVEQGGSLKQLHRLIVTSGAYCRTAHPAANEFSKDHGNAWLSRQNLRRLSAEQLRDALLAVSGRLRSATGGPPVWPSLPSEVLQANPAFLDDNAEKTKGWYPSPADQRSVRSIYLVQKRTVRVPFLETFDQPENSASCPQRNVSIVAPQALSLMNGEESLEAARSFSARVENEAGPSQALQVRRAFQLAYQRDPTERETALAEGFLEKGSLFELCRALLNGNEFAYLD
ncbi:MAG: PSD1 domain-containing protein [Verrucomicrobiales bacterium]|nr:PSD1 domain-containing protein [Verrucomicrobiales bacterium]